VIERANQSGENPIMLGIVELGQRSIRSSYRYLAMNDITEQRFKEILKKYHDQLHLGTPQPKNVRKNESNASPFRNYLWSAFYYYWL
jgi:hypothetical protein